MYPLTNLISKGIFHNIPIMPGVLIVEAMAQTSGALVVKTLGDKAAGKIVFFMSIDERKIQKTRCPRRCPLYTR